jgi:hypothetical protein
MVKAFGAAKRLFCHLEDMGYFAWKTAARQLPNFMACSPKMRREARTSTDQGRCGYHSRRRVFSTMWAERSKIGSRGIDFKILYREAMTKP